MAQTYFPFDSGTGANVTETQWSKMARYWLCSGVHPNTLNEFAVYADSTGMQVKVKTGRAWMRGHFFESDAEVILPIAAANATLPRIDRVVMRVDWVANTIVLAVLTGTAAASPVAPTLTQTDGTKWEESLAQIRVDAAVATIASTKVTDERIYAEPILNAGYPLAHPTQKYRMFMEGVTIANTDAQGNITVDAGITVQNKMSLLSAMNGDTSASGGYVYIGGFVSWPSATTFVVNTSKANVTLRLNWLIKLDN